MPRSIPNCSRKMRVGRHRGEGRSTTVPKSRIRIDINVASLTEIHNSILVQGWTPIDAILVAFGHDRVAEGHRGATEGQVPADQDGRPAPCDDLQKKAFDEANTVMSANPDVKLFMSICTPAVPGAAEAVKQSGRTDVKVIGLGLPNDNKSYVHAGITDCVVLWNTMDLGYLTVQAARAQGWHPQERRHSAEGRPSRIGRDPGRQHPAGPAVPVHQGEYRQV